MTDNGFGRVNRFYPKAQITCQYHEALFSGVGVSTETFTIYKDHSVVR